MNILGLLVILNHVMTVVPVCDDESIGNAALHEKHLKK